MELNIGPNHPSTHGVLRLVTVLDGELVVGLRNVLGYVHTGIEKNIEQKTYWKAITYVPRMDYLSFFTNERVSAWRSRSRSTSRCRAAREWIRVLFQELNRIHYHLIFLGTGSVDLGGIALLFYCFRERDRVLDLFEMATGVRMHDRYAQVGGVAEDLPAGFERECRSSSRYCATLDEYEELIAAQPICRDAPRASASLTPEFAPHGPHRAERARLRRPVRPARAGPTARTARSAARARAAAERRHHDRSVRLEEIAPSLDIVEQVLDGLAAGPWISDDRKVVLPPRHELHTSMESLIHHFKLVTEGFRVPAGQVYVPLEGPRGELGFHLVSDGSSRPGAPTSAPPA